MQERLGRGQVKAFDLYWHSIMKLSIITVNLNNMEGLQKTCDSIISQTFKDFEWIVIDGGSADGSKELIEEYGSNISYWVSEPDKGIYNAMNKGIKVAKGEYLYFLNSGDYLFDSNALSDVFLDNPKEDIVYGFVAREHSGRTKILDGFLAKDDISLIDLYYQTIPHQGTFFKSSLFEKYGLYNENLKIVADREFYIKTIIYGNVTVKFYPITIAVFEDGGISSTSPYYQKEKKEVLNSLVPPRIYKDMINAVSKREICNKKFPRFLYSCLYRLAIAFK